ncbi:MAG: glucokinase [Pseudomonadales bacterium]|nr:glucokinase [Pseudomonadales bacterium]
MTQKAQLIGDIGGTNARFALTHGDGAVSYQMARSFACAEHVSPEAAISAYLEDVGAPRLESVCIAAAGPVTNGAIRITNHPWVLQSDALAAHCDGADVQLLNDFEAVAHALPHLAPEDILVIGSASPELPPSPGFCQAVVGPGTGLGAAGLRDAAGGPVAIESEAGHAGFASESALQDALLEHLRSRYGRVSVERLVSGRGLGNLHAGLAAIRGIPAPPLDAPGVFAAATKAADPLADEALALFYEMLGQFAGDLALQLGAWSGVFLTGGVAQRAPERLAASRLRAGFENKGRHRELMKRIPTALIMHPQPGLLGAAAAVAKGQHAQ